MEVSFKDHKIKTRLQINRRLHQTASLIFLLIVCFLHLFPNRPLSSSTSYFIFVFLYLIMSLLIKEYLFKQVNLSVPKLFWLIDLLDVSLVSFIYYLGYFPINFLLSLYLLVIYLSTRQFFTGEIFYITFLSMVGLLINTALLWSNNSMLNHELGYSPFSIIFALLSILLSGLLAFSYSKTDHHLTHRLEEMLNEKETVLEETHLTHAKLEEKYAFAYTLTLIQQFLLEELDEENLLTRITDIIQGVLGSFACAILGVNKDHQIELLAFSGKELFPALLEVTNQEDSLVLQTIRSQTIHDENSASAVELKYWRQQGIKSLVTIPLSTKVETLGVMLAANLHKLSFNQEQQEQMMIIANQVSLALENTRLHKETQRMAWHDSLTGLYNRNYLDIFLSIVQDNNRIKLGCMLFDLDYFKEVNDTYGHLTGDQVLKTVAAILKKHSTSGKIAARYGGEEFIILCLDINLQDLFHLAETIKQEVAETPFFTTKGQQFNLTISCGIASIPEHSSTIPELFARADEALYQAKNSGRNQVKIYSLL